MGSDCMSLSADASSKAAQWIGEEPLTACVGGQHLSGTQGEGVGGMVQSQFMSAIVQGSYASMEASFEAALPAPSTWA